MSNDTEKLESEYRKYAEEHGSAYKDYDYKRTNKFHDKFMVLLPRMRENSDRGEEILRRLMKDKSGTVVLWAGTHSLPIAEKEAIATLDSIVQKGGVFGFDAKMVIREWQGGRLKVD